MQNSALSAVVINIAQMHYNEVIKGAVIPWRLTPALVQHLTNFTKMQNVQIGSDLRTSTWKSALYTTCTVFCLVILPLTRCNHRTSPVACAWSSWRSMDLHVAALPYRPNCLRLWIRALVQNYRLRCPLLHLRRAWTCWVMFNRNTSISCWAIATRYIRRSLSASSMV